MKYEKSIDHVKSNDKTKQFVGSMVNRNVCYEKTYGILNIVRQLSRMNSNQNEWIKITFFVFFSFFVSYSASNQRYGFSRESRLISYESTASGKEKRKRNGRKREKG